jgi:hypothetical protein
VTRSKVSDQCWRRLEAKSPPLALAGDLSGPDSGTLRRTVWFGPEFDFLTVKVNQIKRKHPSFSAWIYPNIPVRIRFCWAAAKNKKDCEIKEHIPKLFCRMKKTRRTCARRQRRTELVRPHHSCQFEVLRPDLFFSLSLSFASSLAESLSLLHSACYFLMRSLWLCLDLKFLLYSKCQKFTVHKFYFD